MACWPCDSALSAPRSPTTHTMLKVVSVYFTNARLGKRGWQMRGDPRRSGSGHLGEDRI